MSNKGMLDSIIPALLQVPNKYRGVVLNVNQRLAGEDASLWHSRFAKVLREKLPKEKEADRQYHFLKPLTSAVSAVFDPQSLLKRKDIWLSPEFINRILSVAEAFQITDDLPAPSVFDIIEPANDTEIRSEFPKGNAYGASEFCYRLSKMTGEQPTGASGSLLNSGYVDIFYVVGKGGEVFAVYVLWDSDDRPRSVRCCRLDEGARWRAGSRAFSRN